MNQYKISELPEMTAPDQDDLLEISDVSAQISKRIKISNILSESYENSLLSRLHPVGSIYINATNSTNPGTLFGFGTWVAFGQGRVPVGYSSTETEFNAAEKAGGSKTHTLSASEMPSHTHSVDPPSTSTTSDSHSHSMSSIVDNLGSSNTNNALTDYPGANLRIVSKSTGSDTHSHSVNIPSFTSGSAGSGAAHNNIQPYITVYMWKRTA